MRLARSFQGSDQAGKPGDLLITNKPCYRTGERLHAMQAVSPFIAHGINAHCTRNGTHIPR